MQRKMKDIKQSITEGAYNSKFNIKNSNFFPYSLWQIKGKNGVVWDKFGIFFDNFGIIVDNFGAVWDKVGIKKNTKNSVFIAKTQKN